MLKTVFVGLTIALTCLPARAHEDPRNVQHWHGGVDPEITMTEWPNGTIYVTEQVKDGNRSWAKEKDGAPVRCVGAEEGEEPVSEEEMLECFEILKEAEASGDPQNLPAAAVERGGPKAPLRIKTKSGLKLTLK